MGKKKGSDSESDADVMDLDSDYDEQPKGKGKGKEPKGSTPKGKATKEAKDAGGNKGKPKPKPKAAKEPKMFTAKTPEDLALEEEGRKLKKHARQAGVIASEREDEDYSAVSKLKPSAQIKKFSQAKPQEIHKKSTHRKNKVLFKFPGLIDLVQEGTFGTLSNMNTNPILDVDFPDGKLRLEGTHVHTKQKFISITPKGKHKTMVAQDVFDHMVVFAKHSWIGKDEKEPSGRDIPDSVFTAKHKDVQYAAGAAGGREHQAGEDSAQSTLDSWRVAGDDDASQGGSQLDGRARRASAAKKIKYTDGDSDFDSGGDASDDADMSDGEAEGTRSPVSLLPAGVEVVLKGPAKPRSTPSKSAGGASKQSNISSFFTKSGKEKAINLDSDEDEDEDDDMAPSSSQRDTTTPKRESAKKPIKSYKVDSSSADDGSGSEQESEEDKPKPKKKPAPKKPPVEKKAPAKRKKKDSDDDDDGDDSDCAIVKKPAPKKAAAPRKTPAKKKSKGSDSEDDFNEDSDDEDFGTTKKKPEAKKATPAKKAPAPKKKAAAPPKKTAKKKGSDDESSSPPEDDDDDDDWA